MSNIDPPTIKVWKTNHGWGASTDTKSPLLVGGYDSALQAIQGLKVLWLKEGNLDAKFPSCHEIIDTPEQNTA